MTAVESLLNWAANVLKSLGYMVLQSAAIPASVTASSGWMRSEASMARLATNEVALDAMFLADSIEIASRDCCPSKHKRLAPATKPFIIPSDIVKPCIKLYAASDIVWLYGLLLAEVAYILKSSNVFGPGVMMFRSGVAVVVYLL